MIPYEHLLTRKGPRTTADVDPTVLNYLNVGKLPTVNLCEWLVVDQRILIETVLKEYSLEMYLDDVIKALNALKQQTAMKSITAIGETLARRAASDGISPLIFEQFRAHPSDIVRSYACYFPPAISTLSLEEQLEMNLPLVADPHFGVREVVWMAMRPHIDAHLENAILFLQGWTSNADENVRRFVSEATRPRGVWCKHIDRLKESPELALPLLDPLRKDSSVYVQNSVGNWLNDASKTRPDFVLDLCRDWTSREDHPATQKIVRRALRTLEKG